jgi:glutamate racemase
LIKKEVESYYQKKTEVLDSALWVAKAVKEQLDALGMRALAHPPEFRFFVSYLTPAFEKSARLFFPGKVKFQENNIWK